LRPVTVYVIVGGEGKKRLNRSAEMRESLTWLNVVFSTGEISLERHMKSADSDARLMGGQEVRIVSIPADAEAGHGVFETLYGFSASAFADMLKRASNDYYGTPLVAWLEALAARRDALVLRARKAADEFKAKYARTGGPQVGRVAESFALVAAAGTLATREGITGWPDGAAFEGAAKCFDAWLKERGTDGSSDEASILKQVRRFYQLHGDSRFRKQGEDSRVIINQAGFLQDDEFLTFDQVFETEVCRGFEPRQVAGALRKNGYLVTDKGRYTTKRTPFKQHGTPRIGRGKQEPRNRFYVVRWDSIFGDEQQLPLVA
jgi:putative DNA primase/helicase